MAEALGGRERAFLAGARVGRLATADASGRPHAVPVVFVLRGGLIYTPIDAKPKRDPRRLRRLRNIAANERVCLLVDRYEEDWTALGFVLVEGRAGLLSGDAPGQAEEYAAAAQLLREKYPQYGEVAVGGPERAMIRIVPERCVSWGAV